MANAVETLVANSPIKSPVDKYYNFFKYDMNEIIKIFLAAYTGVELLEGEDGVVGNVKLWYYILGGVPMTAKVKVKVKVEVLDDTTKTIKFVALEGELMLLYKSFTVTLAVSEGLAKWTIEFEKATILSPPPQLYVPLFATLGTLVDAYLLLIN